MPYYACLTVLAGNDLRNLMCLIMVVLPYQLVTTSGVNAPYCACRFLPYRLVMTPGINVPYYACLTISPGNDLRN